MTRTVPVNVITFRPMSAKNVKGLRDGAPGGRDPLNCPCFWSLVFLSRVKSANGNRSVDLDPRKSYRFRRPVDRKVERSREM